MTRVIIPFIVRRGFDRVELSTLGCSGLTKIFHKIACGICIRCGMLSHMSAKVILDLCGGTGAWSRPYAEAGYHVINITLPEHDVRLYSPPSQVHGILSAPPCTVFASSGARWLRSQEEMFEGLGIVDACLRIVVVCKPHWWVLENPVGTLRRWLGPPKMYFHPYEYGDPYPKKTCLWGDFTVPAKHPVAPTDKRIHTMPPSPDRVKLRSMTPQGFARAFFEANP